MKSLKFFLIVFSLSFGYILPAVSASAEVSVEQQEQQKHIHKAPRHHRGMSMAMMKDLNLNDEQKTQWKKLNEKKRAETANLREKINKLHEQEREVNEKYEAEIKKILTAEQIKKYESMLQKRPEKPHSKRMKPKKES
ncbi:MAG: Spy/CpxP family protein refolding chaperone [Alphaproteobacteria bacterium]|nr:Spy/CpxP family protein refolding chaperone [Alphaproteobacteria bacterium]